MTNIDEIRGEIEYDKRRGEHRGNWKSVDPVVGDPVPQDNNKIFILGVLSPPSV